MDESHPDFKQLKSALKQRNGMAARLVANRADAIKTWAEGKLTVDKFDNVLFDGKPVEGTMHARILKMVREKASVTSLVKFLTKCAENPNQEAVRDLYKFLEFNDLPIMEDGDFLAFRAVTRNFRDKHSGTFNNNVGQTVRMDREKCDADRGRDCSTGLHFCRRSYLNDFRSSGDRIIIVRINPKNVTSIPEYAHSNKGRCCEFYVMAEVTPDFKIESLFTKSTTTTASVEKKLKVPQEKRRSAVKKAIKKLAKRVEKAFKKTQPKKAVKKAAAKKAVKKAPAKKAVKKVVKKAAKKTAKRK